MARRSKKKAGLVELLGTGILRESLAPGRTAKNEITASTDFMSGKQCKCRRR